MTLDEINAGIEECNRKLYEYKIQIEVLSAKEDPSSEEVQSEFERLMDDIGRVTVELDNLISKIS